MNTEILDRTTLLPHWMQFIIILLFVITAIILWILKFIQEKKTTDKQAEIANKLIKNEDKLSTLLDLLFERFANNVTIDVAKGIIGLVYSRTNYSIKDRVIEINKSSDILKHKSSLEEFINNRYYEDSMFLARITYKGLPLNFYHSSAIKPDKITQQILDYIALCPLGKCSSDNEPCKNLDVFISAMFTTIINKTSIKLDERSNIANTYGQS